MECDTGYVDCIFDGATAGFSRQDNRKTGYVQARPANNKERALNRFFRRFDPGVPTIRLRSGYRIITTAPVPCSMRK